MCGEQKIRWLCSPPVHMNWCPGHAPTAPSTCIMLLSIEYVLSWSEGAARKWYSLRPKMIVLLLRFCCPKMIVRLSTQLEMEAQSQIFSHQNLLVYQEGFSHRNFQGHFGVVVVFYFKSHTYNFLVNRQRTLISPKLETWTIVLGWRSS